MYKVYTFKDTLAESYSELQIFKNDMVACRTFADLCRNEKHPFYIHPENYIMFSVGTWDENTGTLVATDPKEVAKATNYTVNKEIQ